MAGLADQRRLSPNTAAALLFVLLGAAILLWQRPWQTSQESVVEVPANAAAVLTQQFRALSDATTQSQFVDAAGAGAQANTFARHAWSARQSLGAREVRLRYISGGDAADRDDGSTQANVEVSWSAGSGTGLDDSLRTSTIAFRMAPQADGTFAVQSVSAASDSLPLWLAGEVVVRKQADTVIIAVDGGIPDLPVDAMAATARDAVADVISSTTGEMVVIAPHTQNQMAQLVGRDAGDVDQIAAVTTRLDGSSGTAGGDVVLLNPTLFSTMDKRAAQVVLSHEATHLLTPAVGTRAETWVVEGFADFVALHDDDAPLSLSAGQVLAEVTSGKIPERLPSSADFASTSHGLGAVYESVWMIFRLLSETHSDADIVGFYDDVLAGTPVETALTKAFGLTLDQLTRDWQDYLVKSASTVS